MIVTSTRVAGSTAVTLTQLPRRWNSSSTSDSRGNPFRIPSIVQHSAGSTAYNLSVHGPILSLNSKKLAVTPISPFRPRRWKGKIVSDKTKIYISNIDSKKRPIAAVADNNEIRNIAKVKIVINKRIKCKLLFNSQESLIKKIKLEQKKQFN